MRCAGCKFSQSSSLQFLSHGNVVTVHDSLQTLKADACEDLMVQLTVFTEHKEDDYGEFMNKFDNIRLEFDDLSDCFEVVKNLVIDTASEPYLLSILQHLLFIRDDTTVR